MKLEKNTQTKTNEQRNKKKPLKTYTLLSGYHYWYKGIIGFLNLQMAVF